MSISKKSLELVFQEYEPNDLETVKRYSLYEKFLIDLGINQFKDIRLLRKALRIQKVTLGEYHEITQATSFTLYYAVAYVFFL